MRLEHYGGMPIVLGTGSVTQKNGIEDSKRPFPPSHAQIPVILGQWWKSDVQAVFFSEFVSNGGSPNLSDAFMINGQPGDFYPCSKSDTFKLSVEYGNTYLIQMFNTAMNDILFFSIAKHQITVVGSDGAYTKPFKSDYIAISPGQTIDFLLEANQAPDHYYMAAKAYNSARVIAFENSTTTAIIEYLGDYTSSSSLYSQIFQAAADPDWDGQGRSLQ